MEVEGQWKGRRQQKWETLSRKMTVYDRGEKKQRIESEKGLVGEMGKTERKVDAEEEWKEWTAGMGKVERREGQTKYG